MLKLDSTIRDKERYLKTVSRKLYGYSTVMLTQFHNLSLGGNRKRTNVTLLLAENGSLLRGQEEIDTNFRDILNQSGSCKNPMLI